MAHFSIEMFFKHFMERLETKKLTVASRFSFLRSSPGGFGRNSRKIDFFEYWTAMRKALLNGRLEEYDIKRVIRTFEKFLGQYMCDICFGGRNIRF